ncbi:uncharacterized protein F4812DRAFT_216124 [Daldinia caldariorum]|uniref:uncharacterized protein n=1 Tax=Daldinia caldariorum TaxID=326644 RepID=UPI002007B43D|nr:uncharacterized protein F4812DRAFT_216124 [Daldinia caldariorum]KAI1464215.1 hypothetical protein F4812DRAFT_216124 [Daldinia caldariorum]
MVCWFFFLRMDLLHSMVFSFLCFFLLFFEIPGNECGSGCTIHGDISQATKWVFMDYLDVYGISRNKGTRKQRNKNAYVGFLSIFNLRLTCIPYIEVARGDSTSYAFHRLRLPSHFRSSISVRVSARQCIMTRSHILSAIFEYADLAIPSSLVHSLSRGFNPVA